MRDPRNLKVFDVCVSFEGECVVKVEAYSEEEALRFVHRAEMPSFDECDYTLKNAYIDDGLPPCPCDDDDCRD